MGNDIGRTTPGRLDPSRFSPFQQANKSESAKTTTRAEKTLTGLTSKKNLSTHSPIKTSSPPDNSINRDTPPLLRTPISNSLNGSKLESNTEQPPARYEANPSTTERDTVTPNTGKNKQGSVAEKPAAHTDNNDHTPKTQPKKKSSNNSSSAPSPKNPGSETAQTKQTSTKASTLKSSAKAEATKADNTQGSETVGFRRSYPKSKGALTAQLSEIHNRSEITTPKVKDAYKT